MSLPNVGASLDGSDVTPKDWGIAVGGGLIGSAIAGFELSTGMPTTSFGVVAAGVGVGFAAVAFTDAYLNAAVLDERGGQ